MMMPNDDQYLIDKINFYSRRYTTQSKVARNTNIATLVLCVPTVAAWWSAHDVIAGALSGLLVAMLILFSKNMALLHRYKKEFLEVTLLPYGAKTSNVNQLIYRRFRCTSF